MWVWYSGKDTGILESWWIDGSGRLTNYFVYYPFGVSNHLTGSDHISALDPYYHCLGPVTALTCLLYDLKEIVKVPNAPADKT